MTVCSLCRPALAVFSLLPSLPEAYQYRPNLIRTKFEVPYFWNNVDKGASSDSVGVQHHSSLESLVKSAEECPLCKVILHNVQTFISDFRKLEEDPISRYYTVELQGHGLPAEWSFKLMQRPDGGEGFSVFAIGNRQWMLYMVAAFGFCAEPGTPAAGAIRGLRIDPDIGSGAPLDQARRWISDCAVNHECCKPLQGPLPSRLLDLNTLDDHDNIRLWETKGAAPRTYVALSHCWGKDSSGHVKTTHATLPDYLRNIAVERLPKTFQDAINVTRDLGYRFLWIDSLCICQDDMDEWARESAAMTNVYAGAHVVIAADGSPGSTHGFSHRSERKHIPVNLVAPPENVERAAQIDGPSTTFSALVFETKLTHVLTNRRWLEFEAEPLANRAWGLQERLLPHRLLHFGTDQLFFECNSHFLSEDGIKIVGRWNALYPGHKPEFLNMARESRVSQTHRLWYLILEEFTSRHLTIESDRFPSIAGLAKAIKDRLDGNSNTTQPSEDPIDIKYVAGLWSNSLVEGLGWNSFDRRGTDITFPDESPLVGEKGYIAPTWSWASFTGTSSHGNTMEDWADIATVVDWSVSLKDHQSPYGELVDGQIKLRAPVLRLTVSDLPEHDQDKLPEDWRRNIRFCTPNGDPFGSASRLDGVQGQTAEMRAWANEKELFALVLSKREEENPNEVQSKVVYESLIITPTIPKTGAQPGGKKFRRVGTLLMSCNAMCEDESAIADPDSFLEITLI